MPFRDTLTPGYPDVTLFLYQRFSRLPEVGFPVKNFFESLWLSHPPGFRRRAVNLVSLVSRSFTTCVVPISINLLQTFKVQSHPGIRQNSILECSSQINNLRYRPNITTRTVLENVLTVLNHLEHTTEAVGSDRGEAMTLCSFCPSSDMPDHLERRSLITPRRDHHLLDSYLDLTYLGRRLRYVVGIESVREL